MNYGEVLQRAWQIIWKHKILWIFGILAGCGNATGNTGGSSNTGYRFQGGELPSQFQNFFFQVQRFFENIPVWVWILLGLMLLVLFVIAIILNTVGRTGLVLGALQADEGTAHLSFGTLFSTSFSYFWRVFFLNLIVGFGILILVLILIVPVILLGVATLGVGLLCLIPIICLLIPISWFINLVLEQSVIAIVTENRGIFSGLERGWQVVTTNIGPMIIMALILFVAGAVIGFIIAIPMALIVIPPLVGLVARTQTAAIGGLVVAAILFVLYLPVLLVATGILRGYITTAWTLTFRRLTGHLPAEAPRADVSAEPISP